MIATDLKSYEVERRAEARKIIGDAQLCAARPGLRSLAWDILRQTTPRGPATLNLTGAMRADRAPDADPETAA